MQTMERIPVDRVLCSTSHFLFPAYLRQLYLCPVIYLVKQLMKYLTLLFGALCCTVLVRGQSFEYNRDYEKGLSRSRDKTDMLYYPRLLPRFLTQDTTLTVTDMLYLMIGYTGLPGFRPYQDMETEKRIYRLNNEAQYAAAILICDTFLQQHPLNQSAIIEKAYAFHQLGKKDSAAFYKEQFGRIMAAMDWSGNGHDPESAIFSIGPYDGQNFIDKYYHADLGRSGSAEDSKGNFCYQLEMLFKRAGQKQAVVLFFAIQHAVNTTAASPNKGALPK